MEITLLVPFFYFTGWLILFFLSRMILRVSPEDALLVAIGNGVLSLIAIFLFWQGEFRNMVYLLAIFFTARTLISAILVWREQNKPKGG